MAFPGQLSQRDRLIQVTVHPLQRGGDPLYIFKFPGIISGGFRVITADQEQQLPDHAADHGFAVRLHIFAFFHDPADTVAQFRMFFPIHDIGEIFAAAVFQCKTGFCCIHVACHQSGRVKIQESPAGHAAGIAGGQMNFPGGDDDCVPGFEGENLTADQEHAGAAVTIADLKKIVNMSLNSRGLAAGVEHCLRDGKIRRYIDGRKGSGDGCLLCFFHIPGI